MKRFGNNQRIVVVYGDSPLLGKVGIVRRLRIKDNGAWVEMCEDLPDSLRLFPQGDTRANHILLYPEDCKPEVTDAER